ncbi:MAG: UDP-N-acetylmuramyl-tripeptide synthetase [Candidatus Falkowbacteria bacterium GW2011_GWF2_39_8]|uniref:UDP-N-acetylmuramyl-tripeptide synthetase n=1 Tax=Candidatus Falkowbacteria bacterium GW2011_GWF2_39_8 TaxID=1618642 RepID=A0A0G0PYJ6_9BACT|nr:MAG: UDP-N-acetylmuramyl-tripeptide synthetase [Candidatus Falkowbacteria bacterium GW2011_GWF2_39_8]
MNKLLYIIKKIIPSKLFKRLQPAYHFLLAWFAGAIYRWPSEKLIIIGVTGTTGKTTSTFLIAKTLKNIGYKVGYTSTAMFNDGKKEWLNDKKMTMAGRFFTQSILNKMVKNGCQYAVVETTSEGIRQFRHRFINYDILVFTGLYPEHIESHGGFENYKAAKGQLFAHLKNCKTKYADDSKKIIKIDGDIKKLNLNRVKKSLIVNLDDEYAEYFLNFWAEEKSGFTQGFKKNIQEVKAMTYGEIFTRPDGISFAADKTKINLKLLGEFNAGNAMTAIGVAKAQGVLMEKIKQGIEKITGVPGRLEMINLGQDFTVIVDYSFEPNAFTKLYETINLLPHNQIIHVFGGTGGGRDVSRRPILGRIAGEKADIVIATNEDPYDENPEIIVDQVIVGAEKGGKIMNQNLFKVMDRREAIAKAVDLAKKDDIVLITGKGSEQLMCLANDQKIPWDDRKVASEEIETKLAKIK